MELQGCRESSVRSCTRRDGEAWQIALRGTAALSDPAVLHPTLQPDRAGTFVLALTAHDALATGQADEVTITVTCASLRGDANGDGQVNVTDVFHLINHLFAAGPVPVGNGDANADGTTTVADVFHLISFLFAGGPPPPA